MTTIPTTHDLLDLEARLEEDGFSEHDFTILSLVSAADSIGVPRRYTDTLADTSLPEMTRRNALGQLANVWADHAEASATQKSQETGLRRLLCAWRAHQDLRKQEASVAELFASRNRLDEARTSITRRSPQSGCGGLSPC